VGSGCVGVSYMKTTPTATYIHKYTSISIHSRACNYLGPYNYDQPYYRRATINHLLEVDAETTGTDRKGIVYGLLWSAGHN
jgi:hypothetical protein